MADVIPDDEQPNYETFRECLSEPVLRALATPVEKSTAKQKRAGRKKGGSREENEIKTVVQAKKDSGVDEGNDAEDLAEFIDYLASLLFPALPAPLRTLTHATFKSSRHLQETYTPPLPPSTAESLITLFPPSAIDSLTSYSLLPAHPDTHDQSLLLTPILEAYLSAVTAPPPDWSSTRTDACELCERSWIPLTYHHLIPRQMHAKALKRGWHTEDRLGSVAWICRACHNFVHRVETNEGLAKEYFTVERLLDREDVRGWVRWVGRVRWRAR